ncbi:CRN-like protein [Plasmopara halstedii]|uniref:CRN-like protein n=1 Tax=Plasmopara halstedii TaxID=4781 RepID=A0A0P1AN85_PLAHL|nr:CRN-like protein [Plasmopara halstedii]CEG42558.1 CRN-like protein [Plasmopara halstedii]|eukprot:XP_024578927.1 CRN-like protein [Plasmopara halstedii]
MVTLYCAIAGLKRNAFSVDIDTSQSVGHLKDAIAQEQKFDFAASKLELYLAKKGESWLTENEVKNGVRDISGLKHLSAAGAILHRIGLSDEQVVGEVDGIEVDAGNGPVNVLVVVPTFVIVEEDESSEKYLSELTYYQHCGRLIQYKYRDYCAHILDKVDKFYDENERPIPFICVEGSSGMGKSQLAFALGGRRPYFYWLATRLGTNSQNNPTSKSEKEILDFKSDLYENGLLWTYGFIRALLEHCSSDEHQNSSRMIRFENQTVLKAEQRYKKDVRVLLAKMKAEQKKLTFFVLDEMTSNASKKLGASRRPPFNATSFVPVVWWLL